MRPRSAASYGNGRDDAKATPHVRRGPGFSSAFGPLGPDVPIVFEDDDLIVVDKPTGLISAVPAALKANPAESLTDRIRNYFYKIGLKRSKNDKVPLPGIIHRLDREASGLIVYTKSARAFSWLKDDFKHKRVHRIYTALVQGVLGKVDDAGTIQSFVKESRTGKMVSIPTDEYRGPVVGVAGAGGVGSGDEREGVEADVARLAVTHYRVVAVGQNRTLVQIRLESGRKHQIRVHMATKGFPLLGDTLYSHGGVRDNPFGRLALHASELGFSHPGTGQTQRYTSPPPPSFYRALGMEPPKAAVDAQIKKSATASPSASPSGSTPTSSSSPTGKPGRDLDTSWNQVAAWYDDLIDERKSDHYTDVIVPGVMRLVSPTPGSRVLDVACGQGVIARAMASIGAQVTGLDAAKGLIDAANKRGGGTFIHADARQISTLKLPGDFDAATCVMALTNIEPIEPVLTGVAEQLRTGGAFVFVISHPAFRAPGQTHWGYDDKSGVQFRRVDGYLSTGQHRIQMHPGDAPEIVTWTFHRPIQTYVRALSQAGFMVDLIEEWTSRRQSQPGPKAEAENRSRREIPLFMAVRAVKR